MATNRISRGEPGTVELVTGFGELVIATGDGHVVASEWETRPDTLPGPKRGDILPSVDFSDQLRRIIDRHVARYPNQPISPLITELSA